jgi:hypothetical protein
LLPPDAAKANDAWANGLNKKREETKMDLLSLILGLVIAGSSVVMEPPKGTEGKGDDKYDCLTPCSIEDPDCVCGTSDDDEKG